MLAKIILANLATNPGYARKVLPYLKAEYFRDASENVAFGLIGSYYLRYSRNPSVPILISELVAKNGLAEDVAQKTLDLFNEFQSLADTGANEDWLVKSTEEYCQDQAITNALREAIKITTGEDKQNTKHAIPGILTKALAVSFLSNTGHDYLKDADERFEYYHSDGHRIPFNIVKLNDITKGGIMKKTLNLYQAGINVGKTFVMCDNAAGFFMDGKNVLYITLEVSEKEIAKRIDASLLDVSIEELDELPKEEFDRKIERLRSCTVGKLKIKEYPTSSASVSDFRALLDDYKMKEGFVPDVVFIDYLGICASSRIKIHNGDMYGYGKSIAEEVRGLAVEYDFAAISAVQLNRTGFSDTDPDLDNTAESFGIPMAADLVLSIICTEEMEELGKFLFIQLKNRYRRKSYMKRFFVGVDRLKMRLYDLVNESGVAAAISKGVKIVTKKPDQRPKTALEEQRQKFYSLEDEDEPTG